MIAKPALIRPAVISQSERLPHHADGLPIDEISGPLMRDANLHRYRSQSLFESLFAELRPSLSGGAFCSRLMNSYLIVRLAGTAISSPSNQVLHTSQNARCNLRIHPGTKTGAPGAR
jgi:hypothetical protein